MSDLSDLAADVSKDLPAQVRRVIDTAIAEGWELNPPGMTLALRLNHPTDEIAQPVYITWAVGRTPKGALSFKFMSCGTRGLVPLSGADLLEYLKDPTVVIMTAEDVAESDSKALKARQDELPPWDTTRPVAAALAASMGAILPKVERLTAADIMRQSGAVPAVAQPLRVAAPALRVQAPRA